MAAACSGDQRSDISEAETTLTRYDRCAALESDLKEMLVEDIEAHFDMERSGGGYVLSAEGDGPPRGDTASGREEGVDYSGTNNQEEGVDEGDFVKTDGYHIYLLNGNRLHIFGVPIFGALDGESTFEIEGSPREMLLDKESGRIAVLSMVSPSALPAEHPLHASIAERDAGDALWSFRAPTLTKVTVIDAANRRAPRLFRELFFEADYQTARLVDHSARIAAFSRMSLHSVDRWLYFWWSDANNRPTREQREAGAKAAVAKLRLEDLVPQVYERLPDRSFTTHSLANNDCRSFHRPTDSQARSMTLLVSFDLGSTLRALDTDLILTNQPQIYASRDTIYIAEPAHDWWWFWWNDDQEDVTNLHGFDISTPGESRYIGSGRVPGTVLSPFSMDEKDGVLRVVTTTDRMARFRENPSQRPESATHLFTLRQRGGKLGRIGQIGGLAPGERVWATRFSDDRAYVVTFRNIDPLFVIDVENPARPRLLGELKVPGVSTYLQEISDDRLLAIGYGGDDQTVSWRPQVSLFDISDDHHPGLLDVQPLAGAGSHAWSEALYEHKAFQFWAPEGLLAVPVSSMGYDFARYDYVSRLELVSVEDGGLSSYGSIDHSPYYNRGDRSRFWERREIRRSIFMGEFVYAISDAGVSVHRLGDLSRVNEAILPGYAPDEGYWWW